MLSSLSPMFAKQTDGSLLCTNGVASMFGDAEDVTSGQDNGISAWGVKYVDLPALMGVALPCQVGGGLYTRLLSGFLVPYRGKGFAGVTQVRVFSRLTKNTVTGYLVDKGPSARLHRPVDLLPAMVSRLGLKPNELYTVNVRVLPIQKGGDKL